MTGRQALRWFGVVGCGIWLFLTLAPFWWVLTTAFKPPQAVSGGPTYLPFVDFQPTLNAFREAFAGLRGDFLGPFINSTLISITATAIAVLFGSMAAYALVRFQFRVRLLSGLLFAAISIGGYVLLTGVLGLPPPQTLGLCLVLALPLAILVNRLPLPGPVLKNDDISFWFVSQRMFPPIVSAFALYLFYVELGREGVRMIDSFWGMTLAYVAFGLPLAVWLMRDFFRAVPIEVEEAALVDDVPRLRIFFQIAMPMALPGLLATAMIVLAFIWNEFLFALLLTSADWQTLPVLLAGQNSSRGDEWWAIAVATLVSIAPMVVVAGALSRMMRSGLLSGAIK